VLKITSSQEEIAQMIGTSRETVSRTIGDFKRNGILRVKGISWTITDKVALQRKAAQ
jgi:CRP/FNR family transcriptional regulator